MDINTRLKVIEELDLYLSEKKDFLFEICNTLGWTEESLQDEGKIQCPYDPGHWIPESSLSNHMQKCSLVKNDYLIEEIGKQPPSSAFFYQNVPSVNPVTIDKETLTNILVEKGLIEKKPLDEMPDVPKTSDRWEVDFNPEQRLAVYDYVVEEAKKANQRNNVDLEDLMIDFEKKDDKTDRPKTQLEILAEQRDYKRRRQSYRAKNVHITKKSYTEIMKEVIENQTSFLADLRKQEIYENQDNGIVDERQKWDPDSVKRNQNDSSAESNHWRSKRDTSKDIKKRERSPSPRDRSYSPKELNHDTQKRERSPKESRHSYRVNESRDHYSDKRKSRSRSPKRKKRKHHRSRSRSRSRKHKKSHRKHKKSSN
ncbi:hypothetical protein CDAR_365221 [Caerostris darwini]|uniref:CHHC U11-48K-type domain-containing protein n=1 Tax=Caerostris darwini TaxID=1538125 RepID=A0AAV4U1J3_9ARAC|nr:hypothetical protein CDAR_365221 [Caerostris darwini]